MRLRLICSMFPSAALSAPCAIPPPPLVAELLRMLSPVSVGVVSPEFTSVQIPPPKKAAALELTGADELLLITEFESVNPVEVLTPPPVPFAVFEAMFDCVIEEAGVPEPDRRPVANTPPPLQVESLPPVSLVFSDADAWFPVMLVALIENAAEGNPI